MSYDPIVIGIDRRRFCAEEIREMAAAQELKLARQIYAARAVRRTHPADREHFNDYARAQGMTIGL